MKIAEISKPIALNIPRVISGSFIVAGTAIGAGMLGIPFVTANAGFSGACLVTIAVWLFMVITGLLFMEITLQMPRGSNILSITKYYLGSRASFFAGVMFLFLYYCFMTAYFAGSAPLFQSIISQCFGLQISPPVATLIFSILFSLIIYAGIKTVDRFNWVLMTGMVLFYFALIGVGFQGKSLSIDYSLKIMPMIGAVPILFGAFGYHNVIPSLCDYLEKDKKSLYLSIVIGTSITLIVYLIWQGFILSNVKPEVIAETLKEGKNPIHALQRMAPGAKILTFATYFSFCALATSVLGVGLSLVDFIRDGFSLRKKNISRISLIFLAFLPPLFLCLTDPTIFYTALGWAGGFGESFLNGMLPILLVWTGRYVMNEAGIYKAPGEKVMLSLLFVAALGVMLIEILDSLKIL